MPDFGSATFSQTDSSNATGTMPSWSGAAAPSTLDDAGRALQGAVTREWNWRSYTLTAGGTSDAKTLTFSVAPAAYYNGQRFAFIANTTNTTTATLNVNSLGAKTIKKNVSGTLTNLSASDMVSGMFCEVAYNTSNDCFVWVNSSGAPLNSPTFTGTPAAPTAAADTNTTQLATTAYVVGQGYLKSSTASTTYQTALGFAPIQQGGGTNQFSNKMYIGWSASSQLRVQVDTTDFGVTWPINISGTAAAPSTANVLSATAGASAGAVGTYGFLRRATPTVANVGAVAAGSALEWATASGAGNQVPAGSWLQLGYNGNASGEAATTLWLRYV